MALRVPAAIKAANGELHAGLFKATRARGATGQAAREVARLWAIHAQEDQEYALPPLGLLQQLAGGEVAPEMSLALALSDKLKQELPDILARHENLVDALQRLIGAATAEGLYEHATCAEHALLQLQHEQEVFYPAAILAGEYVRLALGSTALEPVIAA